MPAAPGTPPRRMYVLALECNTTSVNMNTPSVNTEHVCAFRSLVSPTPVLTQV